MALCQLQWVEEKLISRKDEFRSFFDIQSDENLFFKVFKVPEIQRYSLEKFNKIISSQNKEIEVR